MNELPNSAKLAATANGKSKAPDQHQPHRAGESGLVAGAIGAAASCSGGVGETVEEERADQEKIVQHALAASIMSPARAPCAVKNRNAVISEAVRIMMSRLTASIRISLTRSNSVARATANCPLQATRDQDAEQKSRRFRDHGGDRSPCDAEVEHQHQQHRRRHLMTLMLIWGASASWRGPVRSASRGTT